MSADGQRPPDDGPELGNARVPPQAAGGQPGQAAAGEGGGRRRFRRQRRGGRGRGKGKAGSGEQNAPGYAPPLDAQGRIIDVENDDVEGDDDGPDEAPAAARAQAQAAGEVVATPTIGAPTVDTQTIAAPASEAKPPDEPLPVQSGEVNGNSSGRGNRRNRGGDRQKNKEQANSNAASANGANGNVAQPHLEPPPPPNANGNQALPPGTESLPPATGAAPSDPSVAASGPAAPADNANPANAVVIDAAAVVTAIVASASSNGQPAVNQLPGQQPQQNGQTHGPQQHGHQQHGQNQGRHQNQNNRNNNQQHGQNQGRHQQQPRPPEQTFPVDGYLDIDHRGNGRLRLQKFNFVSQPDDAEVPKHLIERERLRAGSQIVGQSVKRNGRLQMTRVETVEGLLPAVVAARTLFQNLTVIDPDDRLLMETTPKEILTRVIDLVAPIGLGQRALIVAPPKTGKTIMLHKISHAITINRPDVVQMVLLVDERPEEVTDFRRTVKAEVYASSADRPTEEHLQVAEMALERAKRLVEAGKDVVILLDSITRLSRAYNKEVESSGRTLSGGVDSRALERPKRLFGAARNAEEGGSLTIIATALIDTGSRMDEVIFEEFKGTGNLEINLDRALAEKRVFPAINIQTSGTRKEEKLFSQHEYEKVKKLRGMLFSIKPVEAMERLIKSISETKSNSEFLDGI